jgi:CubicO group peptidase (beta-lactamase class C family)
MPKAQSRRGPVFHFEAGDVLRHITFMTTPPTLRRLACFLSLLLLPLTGQAAEFPAATWSRTTPAQAGMDEARLKQARDYALTGEGSGVIVRHGQIVLAWGDEAQRYDLKSSSKAIGVALLGLALKDGKMALDDPAVKYQPELGLPPESNRATGWIPQITLRQLANQTAGFEKPGGYGKLLFAPGSRWSYSDAGPNWLAECVTLAYGRDLDEVMFERVFTPIGIKRSDIVWRENAYRPKEINGLKRREFGSGFSANVQALARLGTLYLNRGRWGDTQILPEEFVALVGRPAKENAGLAEYDDSHGNASEHYSLLWWDNGDVTIPGLPRDAFWSWGLYESLVVVIPSLDVVVARAGPKGWARTGTEHYDVLKPFLEPIAASVREFGKSQSTPAKSISAPYPPSTVIKSVTWAPASTIIRRAKGGDNWPMTWADDDAQYTAYGDGNGFEPFVPAKLSIGFSKVTGGPGDFRGVNFSARDGEFRGDGKSGRKASGLLMVDGVLYLLARNLDNAQLAWSRDHGATWTWADWKFTTSFGCPSFLNFGQNYAGARDDFVYLYSPDATNAYEPADRMVLARVPKAKLADRASYEFFVSRDAQGGASWSKDIAQRGAVFTHAGNSHRGGVTYDAGLKRYLWCQILPRSPHPQGPRFQGGFGLYDAPEPWGPWTTVYFTPEWNVGPGESSSLPTKWMSADGKTVHLVFSGDDSFSVRKGTLSTTQ